MDRPTERSTASASVFGCCSPAAERSCASRSTAPLNATRAPAAATAPATPRLTNDGWQRSIDLLETVSDETRAAGARIAFHPHAGTFVETPEEVDRLASAMAADTLPICLDVGHWIVGGGDPIAALRRSGEQVSHVHLKDVDREVLAELRAGRLSGLRAAVQRRLFTELGAGVLDLDGVLAVLAERRYAGWLMVEQDSSWAPAAEAAAIGRRVLAVALRRVSEPRADGPRDGAGFVRGSSQRS